MRLRAKVREITGATKHFEGCIESGEARPANELPFASWVEIEYRDGGYFLLYFDEANECITDTWHATLSQAKEQAKWEFAIQEHDWASVESTESPH